MGSYQSGLGVGRWGVVRGSEGVDSRGKDAEVGIHAILLVDKPSLLFTIEGPEDRVGFDELVESGGSGFEFGFLVDDPLLVRCVCFHGVLVLRRGMTNGWRAGDCQL